MAKSGEEALRKKRERKKKKAWPTHDLGGGAARFGRWGQRWGLQDLGWPEGCALFLSLSLSMRAGNHLKVK